MNEFVDFLVLVEKENGNCIGDTFLSYEAAHTFFRAADSEPYLQVSLIKRSIIFFEKSNTRITNFTLLENKLYIKPYARIVL